MGKIKAVAFDCDGVVLDSFKNVHQAYKAAAKYFGVSCPEDIEEFRKIYLHCPKWTDRLEHLGIGKKNAKKADEIFKRQYKRSGPMPFNGISETLEELSYAYPLFLITSSHQDDVRKLFTEYGLFDFFQEIRGSVKPGEYCGKTQNLLEIMALRNWMPDQLVMIGDTENDLLEAKQAGVSNVILTDYGYGYNKDKIQQAGYKLKTIVSKPEDILAAINEIELRR